MVGRMPPDHESLLRDLYAAFNARDLDALLAALAPDVDWPNGWEGGRLAGRDAVRAYWERQWAAIDPAVEPVAYAHEGPDTTAVTVAQTVRDRDGALLAQDTVIHRYAFDAAGLVARMDIEEA
jgi:ketosteroid isomerase-like protein